MKKLIQFVFALVALAIFVVGCSSDKPVGNKPDPLSILGVDIPPTDAPINLSFVAFTSDKVDPEKLNLQNINLFCKNGSISMHFERIVDTSFSGILDSDLDPATEYTLTMDDLESSVGGIQDQPFTYTFTTAAAPTPLTILSTIPGQEDTISVSSLLRVTFNQTVNDNTLTSSTAFVKDANGIMVSLNRRMVGATLQLVVPGGLADGSWHSMTLTNGIKSTTNQPLVADTTIMFYTDVVPLANPTTDPVNNATNVDFDKVVIIDYSEDIDGATLTPSSITVTLNGASHDVELGLDNGNIVIGSTSYWAASGIVLIWVTDAVKGVSGRSVPDYSFSFTTREGGTGSIILPNNYGVGKMVLYDGWLYVAVGYNFNAGLLKIDPATGIIVKEFHYTVGFNSMQYVGVDQTGVYAISTVNPQQEGAGTYFHKLNHDLVPIIEVKQLTTIIAWSFAYYDGYIFIGGANTSTGVLRRFDANGNSAGNADSYFDDTVVGLFVDDSGVYGACNYGSALTDLTQVSKFNTALEHEWTAVRDDYAIGSRPTGRMVFLRYESTISLFFRSGSQTQTTGIQYKYDFAGSHLASYPLPGLVNGMHGALATDEYILVVNEGNIYGHNGNYLRTAPDHNYSAVCYYDLYSHALIARYNIISRLNLDDGSYQ